MFSLLSYFKMPMFLVGMCPGVQPPSLRCHLPRRPKEDVSFGGISLLDTYLLGCFQPLPHGLAQTLCFLELHTLCFNHESAFPQHAFAGSACPQGHALSSLALDPEEPRK